MKQILLFLTCSIIFCGCSKDDDSSDKIILQENSKTLNYKDEYQIKASSNKPIAYKSDDIFHAIVSNDGLVSAGRVGKTRIKLTNGDDTKYFNLIIAPKYNTYTEPSLKWGTSRTALIRQYGTPDVQTTDGIGYRSDNPNVDLTMYVFDSNDNLKASAVSINTNKTTELANFLVERYIPVDDDGFVFVNGISEATTIIYIRLSSSSWVVTYAPPSTITGRNNSDENVKKQHEIVFNKLIELNV